ncbi:hypothetical protein RFI_37003, partial [Reticulomyxa filosa]
IESIEYVITKIKTENNNQNEKPNCWSKISKGKYSNSSLQFQNLYNQLWIETKIKKVTEFIVISGDWNANQQTWSDEKIDSVGEVVVDFIIQNGLHILHYNLFNHNLEKNDGKSPLIIHYKVHRLECEFSKYRTELKRILSVKNKSIWFETFNYYMKVIKKLFYQFKSMNSNKFGVIHTIIYQMTN